MDYEMIENKVKEYCEKLFTEAQETASTVEDVYNYRGMAFGALMFVFNDLSPCSNDDLSEDLANWWNEKMRYKFEYLKIKIEEEG